MITQIATHHFRPYPMEDCIIGELPKTVCDGLSVDLSVVVTGDS